MGRLYSHVATSTGWTFRQIDRHRWYEIQDLLSYWVECPPSHLLLRSPGDDPPPQISGGRLLEEMTPGDETDTLEMLRKVTGG